MFIPDGGVDVLAHDMVKQYAADAVDRATLFSNALFVLGETERSKKWMLVRAEIEKIQRHTEQPPTEPMKSSDERLSQSPSPLVALSSDVGKEREERHQKITEYNVFVLIALIAWSELMWVLLLRA